MKSNLSCIRDALQMLRTHPHAADYLRLPRPTPSHARLKVWQEPHRIDSHILGVLARYDDGVHKRINDRAALLARLAACAENGEVGIVETGRDCDCVDYVHKRGTIPATLSAYYELRNRTAEWADGLFSLSVVRPSDLKNVQEESHDRVLEAFEEGRPHHVISTFGG